MTHISPPAAETPGTLTPASRPISIGSAGDSLRDPLALLGTFLKFSVVGIVVTLFNFIAFIGLMKVGLDHLTATAAGWLPSVTLAYILNRKKTFDVRSPMYAGEFVKYLGASVLQLAMSLATMAALVDGLSIPPSVACILNIAVVSGLNFLVLRFLVFGRREATPDNASR